MTDRVAIDIVRPKRIRADGQGPGDHRSVPVLHVQSAAATRAQRIIDRRRRHVNDRFPLFYDNYFVPRGYAFILGARRRHRVLDRLRGPRRPDRHRRLQGRRRLAQRPRRGLQRRRPARRQRWSPTGTTASRRMIGKSYDGTLRQRHRRDRRRGPDHDRPDQRDLRLVQLLAHRRCPPQHQLPERALEQHRGRQHRRRRPAAAPDATRPARWSTRQTLCAPTRTLQDEQDGDEHGDINEFWRDRDHNKDANKVKASVFIVHGFQDDNVRMDHVGLWWDALKANGVKTKLWLMRTGHVDPFEQRRAVWVDTLHRWFDHQLQGIAQRHRRRARGSRSRSPPTSGRNYADWPIPGTQNTDIYLRGKTADSAGTLGARQRRLGRLADVHQHRGHAERDQRDQHAGGLAGQPPRVPLGAADQAAAPLRHARRPQLQASFPGDAEPT